MAELKNTTTPFWKEWKEKREAKKREREEQVARATTDKIAENENTIVSVLESVDFIHSKLPEAVLEFKTNEEHAYGDLEYATKALIAFLKKNPQDVLIDIREIDEKILALAIMFREAVQNGEAKTADATKSFLISAIRDIRTSVPTGIKDNAKLYVETYAKYLDSCIFYCDMARTADKLKDAVINDEEALKPMEEAYKERIEKHKKEIIADDEKAGYAAIIAETDSIAKRSTWSEGVRKLHIEMIQLAMGEVAVEFQRVKLIQDEEKLSAVNGQLDVLLVEVQNIPIVTDPNEMNKYLEAVDNIFKDIVRADQEIDESLRNMKDIDARIKELDNLPGAVRAQETAAEQMNNIIAEIKAEQALEQKKDEDSVDSARGRLGIKTKEQMEELKKQRAVQQSEEVESMLNLNQY